MARCFSPRRQALFPPQPLGIPRCTQKNADAPSPAGLAPLSPHGRDRARPSIGHASRAEALPGSAEFQLGLRPAAPDRRSRERRSARCASLAWVGAHSPWVTTLTPWVAAGTHWVCTITHWVCMLTRWVIAVTSWVIMLTHWVTTPTPWGIAYPHASSAHRSSSCALTASNLRDSAARSAPGDHPAAARATSSRQREQESAGPPT